MIRQREEELQQVQEEVSFQWSHVRRIH